MGKIKLGTRIEKLDRTNPYANEQAQMMVKEPGQSIISIIKKIWNKLSPIKKIYKLPKLKKGECLIVNITPSATCVQMQRLKAELKKVNPKNHIITTTANMKFQIINARPPNKKCN